MSAADLDRALADATLVMLDSSVILAYVNAQEAVHQLALHLFRRIAGDQNPLRACYSAVSVAECLVRPIQHGIQAMSIMSALLQSYPNLEMIPVNYAIAERAAYLRATANLRLPDSLVVATGLLTGSHAVITNDDKWGRLAQTHPSTTWLYLDAFR
jgi:predicted nucleic acid-binding protein